MTDDRFYECGLRILDFGMIRHLTSGYKIGVEGIRHKVEGKPDEKQKTQRIVSFPQPSTIISENTVR
jgi:hypothetical protein